jgi:hypothetical protein
MPRIVQKKELAPWIAADPLMRDVRGSRFWSQGDNYGEGCNVRGRDDAIWARSGRPSA